MNPLEWWRHRSATKWVAGVENFSRDTQGWTGTVTRTACGRFGTVLGGTAGVGVVLSKVYQELPEHDNIRVTLRYGLVPVGQDGRIAEIQLFTFFPLFHNSPK